MAPRKKVDATSSVADPKVIGEQLETPAFDGDALQAKAGTWCPECSQRVVELGASDGSIVALPCGHTITQPE